MSVSTFLGVQTALRGLLAQQRALDVTAHNISNAATPGYSRQEAVIETADSFRLVTGWLGTGVEVSEYRRIRDGFIDAQLRAQTMLQAYHEARGDGLEQVELALAEPSDVGLGSLLDRFWSAWQDVSNAPENPATRQALVQAAAGLAAGFNSLHTQLTTVEAQAGTETALTIDEINSLLGRIAALETPIMNAVAVGEKPSNDLLDERDILVDRLAELVNLSVVPEPDGSVTLRVGTTTLLQGGVATTITSVADFDDPLTGTSNLTAGKLKGLVDLATAIGGPGGYLERLNGVASSLMSQVDALQASGYALGAAAASGIRFFAGADASDIAVNAAIVSDPSLVAASDAPNQPGNGDNALAIAGLRASATIGGAYRQLVTTIGSDAQEAQRSGANAKVLAEALQNRREAVSGVSLDEEMANLVRFQRGFQASARALTAMDELLDVLITRTGRTGL